MSRKLYRVEVTRVLYVVADDERAAEREGEYRAGEEVDCEVLANVATSAELAMDGWGLDDMPWGTNDGKRCGEWLREQEDASKNFNLEGGRHD